jgi:hypothetical protein
MTDIVAPDIAFVLLGLILFTAAVSRTSTQPRPQPIWNFHKPRLRNLSIIYMDFTILTTAPDAKSSSGWVCP